MGLTTVYTASGAGFEVDEAAAPSFSKFLQALEDTGYYIDPAQSGGYANRNVYGTNKRSKHAYGRAIDVNSKLNPHKAPLTTNLPDNIQDIARSAGIDWGGVWRKPDAMHFEYNGPGAGLSSGVGKTATDATGKRVVPGTGKPAPQVKLRMPSAYEVFGPGGDPSPGGYNPSAIFRKDNQMMPMDPRQRMRMAIAMAGNNPEMLQQLMEMQNSPGMTPTAAAGPKAGGIGRAGSIAGMGERPVPPNIGSMDPMMQLMNLPGMAGANARANTGAMTKFAGGKPDVPYGDSPTFAGTMKGEPSMAAGAVPLGPMSGPQSIPPQMMEGGPGGTGGGDDMRLFETLRKMGYPGPWDPESLRAAAARLGIGGGAPGGPPGM